LPNPTIGTQITMAESTLNTDAMKAKNSYSPKFVVVIVEDHNPWCNWGCPKLCALWT